MERRLDALATLGRYLVSTAGKRLLGYYTVPADLRPPKTASGWGRYAAARAGRAWRAIAPYRPGPGVGESECLSRMLRSCGCATFLIPDLSIARIATASAPLFDELRRLRGERPAGRSFDESRMQAHRRVHPVLFSAVEHALSATGAMDAAARYFHRRVRLIDVAPQLNDVSDDFWRRSFADLGWDVPRAAYLHKDATDGGLKITIYLSGVGPCNGPLCYVAGSHRLPRSRLADWVEIANDHALSGTDRATREKFASLPRWLRRKATIGDDLMGDDPLVAALLASEWPVTGPRGMAAMFDPRGLHRGGLVTQGERVAITCVVG